MYCVTGIVAISLTLWAKFQVSEIIPKLNNPKGYDTDREALLKA
jgi:hypothetical protein